MKKYNAVLALLLSFLLLFTGCTSTEPTNTDNGITSQTEVQTETDIVDNQTELSQPEETEQPQQEQSKPKATPHLPRLSRAAYCSNEVVVYSLSVKNGILSLTTA